MSLMGNYMPHGHCYLWRQDLLLLHIGSDLLIALCYFFIPCCLIYLTKKRNDLPSKWIFYLFAGFIFLCGITHVNQIITVWHGVYRYTGVFKLFTAIISLVTAFVLLKLMPRFLNLPNMDDIFKTIELEMFQVFNRIPIGLVSFSKDNVNFVNSYLKDVLGLKTNGEKDQKLFNYINDDYDDGSVATFEVEDKKYHFQVFKEKRNDETVLYFLDNSVLIESTGQVIENYKKHSLAISGVNDGFWQWNINTDQIEWDDKLYSLYQVEKGHVNDMKQFLDIVHPHDRYRIQRALKDHVEEKIPYDIEYRVFVADQYRWFRDRGIKLENESNLMLGTVSDITERKLAAIKLKKVLFASNDLFFDYNFTNDEVWMEGKSKTLDIDMQLIRRAFKSPWTLKLLCPESQRIIFSWWRDLIKSRDLQIQREEILCMKKNDRLIWLKCSLFLEKNEKGETINASGSLTDVTNIKQVQSHLEEKTRDLRKSNELLERFAFVASHDLQAPIRHIKQFVELLNVAVNEGSREDIDRSMNYIREATGQMRELVRGILEYSRIGMESVNLEKVNMNTLFEEVISLTKPLMDRADKIECDIDKDYYFLAIDRFKFKTLIQNIVDNSLKNKSISRKFHFLFTIEGSASEVIMKFKDNGNGLSEGMEGSIFNLFTKGRESRGSGIGLALCDQIAREHGGSIKAYNNDEFGCTFEIRLPKKT
ncbi:ATP-binding protein [Halobacteriovorax sp. GB3]|uniref:PAS domain-containing sensor histidine kinase n=1 Tax=Halobacteriovorax sp. GB3 TaxID=2719615 RepID=UPI00235E1AAF|nr:sensor histidine kinase [Halobacteriovorax sp. GB3]MDD0853560.1 ATP-binding protein [Halobacteriovorax sp. GB3]